MPRNRILYLPFLLFLSGICFLPAQGAEHLLSSCHWTQISVNRDGVYKVAYEDLLSWKILSGAVPSTQIAVVGRKSGMFSEYNAENDSLPAREIAISINDGNDGTFGPGDYFLFYGSNPHVWKYNAQTKYYLHETNIYTDKTYYLVTADRKTGTPKRIASKSNPSQPTIKQHTTVLDYALHEVDLNMIASNGSGKNWFGEAFTTLSPNVSIDASFNDIILDSVLVARTHVVAQNTANFVIKTGNQTQNLNITQTVNSAHTFGVDAIGLLNFRLSTARPRFDFTYSTTYSSTKGYLDYMEFRYWKSLNLATQQLVFRMNPEDAAGEMSEFKVSSSLSNIRVWEVVDNMEPQELNGTKSETTFSFYSQLNENKTFTVFNENLTLRPQIEDTAEIQSIDTMAPVDYVMVVYPSFLDAAERLADFHREQGLSVLITTPQLVYNEYSAGNPDPIAIRIMMKLMQDKAHANGLKPPKYLLLFGAASYDYKGINKNIPYTNFVPTFQTDNSLEEELSLATDDLYGFLDPNESGYFVNDRMDIGIGRIPAITIDQALNYVDKAISYGTPQKKNLGAWRNKISFVADNGEGFASTYEIPGRFSEYITKNRKTINLEKIYSDAYTPVSSTSGMRYPDVNKAINTAVNQGCLILNYVGHSGEQVWSDEVILNTDMINKWSNKNNLTAIFSASCSFSRHDNPALMSAGVWTVLVPEAGSVATVASARIAYTSPNDYFQDAFLKVATERTNSDILSFGEIFKRAKNENTAGNSFALKPFLLLGDPALRIALPQQEVVTTKINEHAVFTEADTIKPLSTTSLEGEIQDGYGNILNDFSGYVQVVVYDKPNTTRTGLEYPAITSFIEQKNILFRGRTNVVNGRFSVEFTAPKDLNFQYGNGKISYYAYSDSIDATGYYDNIIVGGSSETGDDDSNEPLVRLFMGDTFFVNGGITDENPTLVALISDKIGIDMSGNGIGHDITAELDGDSKNPIVLNNFFEYNIGSNTKGSLYYSFSNLSEGPHRLVVKAWNLVNISGSDTLLFHVVKSSTPTIGTVRNTPNPMNAYTYFYYTHNLTTQIKEVKIFVFDNSGMQVATLIPNVEPSGYATAPLYWDGTDGRGSRLRKGIYFYRLQIKDTDGKTYIKSSKMIIL